jgi:hypothetical protein
VENATEQVGNFFENVMDITKNITIKAGEKFADVVEDTWQAIKVVPVSVIDWIH